MRAKLLQGVVAMAAFGIAAQSQALVLGTEVTINDGHNGSTNWHYGSGLGNEDREVEPGMAHGQKWDMEGFFLNGSDLTMVGGYDLWDGQAVSNSGGSDEDGIFSSGDLFISIGKPLYGTGDIADGSSNGNFTETNKYGYDYVFDVDWDTGAWDLYSIDDTATVVTSYYKQNHPSNPWQFEASRTDDLIGSGTLGYEDETFTDAETGKTGGTHYAALFDLSAIYSELSGDETLYAHFTMECGNDNLMGSWTVSVPEPSTLALLGLGAFGIVFSRRKRTPNAAA